MKQLTLNIADDKVQFFLELIKNFDFIVLEEGDDDLAIMANISKGIKDAKEIEEGKLKTRSAQKLLDEL
ncbi:hypothetical protein [Marivirga sp.]|uniref:hypothetical protein n=1 Tax=Marivirga sp. TaxID=2018662 RepID=UPI002D7F0E0A|nr:hypothetical protein [Marivirga sp.]HET8858744.1 hypothetical protein [Marivirga sp.]